jgi:hypothetical protein
MQSKFFNSYILRSVFTTHLQTIIEFFEDMPPITITVHSPNFETDTSIQINPYNLIVDEHTYPVVTIHNLAPKHDSVSIAIQ